MTDKESKSAIYCKLWLQHNDLSKYEATLKNSALNDINMLCSFAKFGFSNDELVKILPQLSPDQNFFMSLVDQLSNLFVYIEDNSNNEFAQKCTPLLCSIGYDNIVALSDIGSDSLLSDIRLCFSMNAYETLRTISYKIRVTMKPLDYPPYTIADMHYNIFHRNELLDIPPHMHLLSAISKIHKKTLPPHMQSTPPQRQIPPINHLWKIECCILQNCNSLSVPSEIMNIIHLFWTQTGNVYPNLFNHIRFEMPDVHRVTPINDLKTHLIVTDLQADATYKYRLQIIS